MPTKRKPTSTANISSAHKAVPRHIYLAVWSLCSSVDEFVAKINKMKYPMTNETAITRTQRYRKGSSRYEAVELKWLEGEGTTTSTLNRTIEELIAAGDEKAIAEFLKENS